MTVKLLLAASALFASTSAWAQSGPAVEQSADDLVCQLSGDCGGLDQLEATQDKPESRGFKLARKATATDPSQASSPSINARTRVKVSAEATSPAAISGKPGRNRTITATAPRPAAGRADLRVTFVTGSAELTDAGRREAEKFMTALAAPSLAAKKFRIEGHTDSVGSREFNLDLSKRRAQAVVEYLAAKGADRTRFSVVGYGFDKPIAGLAKDAGANRRVEVVLVK
ncbi:OmpA family protein [Novosphingobium sp. Gsoil 351]|nr:OmpA family protein [Novosphingobium sp. Gsoil 351]